MKRLREKFLEIIRSRIVDGLVDYYQYTRDDSIDMQEPNEAADKIMEYLFKKRGESNV